MRESLFDVLSAEIDLKREVEKLYKLFSLNKTVVVQESFNEKPYNISYKDFCDRHLYLWDFRNTWTNISDIEKEIGVFFLRNPNISKTCILYCELILNMKKFLETKVVDKYYKVLLNDDILIGNVLTLIKKMGFVLKDEKNRVKVLRNLKNKSKSFCDSDILLKERVNISIESVVKKGTVIQR